MVRQFFHLVLYSRHQLARSDAQRFSDLKKGIQRRTSLAPFNGTQVRPADSRKAADNFL